MCFYKLRDLFLLAKKRERNKKPKRDIGADYRETTSKQSPDKRRKQTTDWEIARTTNSHGKRATRRMGRSTALAREESTGNS